MALGFLFICNGPYEVTVALFSTIKSIHVGFNEATGHFIFSSFHHLIISFVPCICSFLRSAGRGQAATKNRDDRTAMPNEEQ